MYDYYAKYTMTLQELIEVEEVDIFNFPYTSQHKEELEKRFIERYYFREIGYETYSMWHFKLKEKWLRMINHYEKLFENYKDIDPLLDYNEVRNYIENELNNTKEDITGNMTGTASGTSTQKQKDTPISSFDDSDFVSFIGEDKNDNTTTQESIANSLKDVDRNLKGSENKKIMTENQLKRLNEYINKYIDILDRFIGEFNNLFMGIF